MNGFHGMDSKRNEIIKKVALNDFPDPFSSQLNLLYYFWNSLFRFYLK